MGGNMRETCISTIGPCDIYMRNSTEMRLAAGQHGQLYDLHSSFLYKEVSQNSVRREATRSTLRFASVRLAEGFSLEKSKS